MNEGEQLYTEECNGFYENYQHIMESISSSALRSGRQVDDIQLLAATKTVNPIVMNYASKCGLHLMGENKVQEFLSKEKLLSQEIHMQFIGTLQTNKVKYVVGKVEMIQSVDSVRLAQEIAKRSKNLGITTDILVEINIGNEQAKSGISPDVLDEFLSELSMINGISVKGLMTLGPILENRDKKTSYFEKMQKLFVDKTSKKLDNVSMNILSMGMSNDFDLAIECGATMVRVGSALFGNRIYN